MSTLLRQSCLVIATAVLAGCGASAPATLEFVQISPAQPRLGEVTTVRFLAKDTRGESLAGATVGFHLKTDQPGATLTPTEAVTIKGSGYAETQLVITSRVTSVVVVAESPPCKTKACNAGERVVESPPLSFAGAVPNQKQFTFQCGVIAGTASGGVHAIGPWDETRYLIAGIKLKCYAHTADRNGDGVPGALVSFLTEAGTIGPTDTTKTDVIGNAEILYKTSYPIPRETDPVNWVWTPPQNDLKNTGEYVVPLWMHPFEWTSRPVISYGMAPNLQEPRRRDPIRKTTAGGNIVNNLRDNLVTMIAITAGEEAFIDTNNNGVYDNSEPFEDLTEPFVDTNDNGTWEQDERYVDTNGNGTWDGKNGQWDSSSLIWVEDRILWTGVPEGQDLADTVDPIFRLIEPPPGTTPLVKYFSFIPVSIQVCDPWNNKIAQNSDNDACELGDGADDTPLVKASPKVNLGGKSLTYPSCPVANFTIKDARDPATPFPDLRPIAIPPIAWQAPLCCNFTSSPVDGHNSHVCVATITGLVE